MNQDFISKLYTGIKSCPILYIPHYHTSYLDDAFIVLQDKLKLQLTIKEFDIARGPVDFTTKKESPNADAYRSNDDKNLGGLKALLKSFVDGEENGKVFILKNIGDALKDGQVQSMLQLFASQYFKGKYDLQTTLVIFSPIPIYEFEPGQREALEKILTVLEIIPPNDEEIRTLIEGLNLEVNKLYSLKEKSLKGELCRTLQGLDLYEVEQIVRSSISKTKQLTPNTIKCALEEKKQIVRKSGIIEVIDSDVQMSEVGGLEILKADLKKKASIYKNISEAQEYGVPIPKGVLVLGMPGCGKSMIAKAIANEFNVSLLRLDMNRLLGSYVGQSESNLRRALQAAEAAHPTVLWIDEIEKAFAGTNTSDNDMLVMRLMGQFLTWMQEHKSAVFIVATANDVMRSEFMRKGRFDEVYFVDFPDQKERQAILSKKIEKCAKGNSRNFMDLSAIDTNIQQKIASEMVGGNKEIGIAGFSGAEIESVVNTVIERAFVKYIEKDEDKREVVKIELDDFTKAISEIKDSVMCSQIGTKEAPTNVQRIRMIQKQYGFKSASKQ